MDCADVRAALSRGEVPRGTDAAAHLSTCPACATLVEAPAIARALDAAPTPDGGDMPALLRRTLAAVDEEDRGMVGRMRARSTSARIALGFALALLAPLLVVFVTPRPDLGLAPPGRLALALLLYALPGAAALVLALWPMQRAVSARTRVLVACAAVLSAACVAALPQMPTGLAASDPIDAFAQRAIACLVFGTIAALPCFVALRLFAREGVRVGPKAWVLGLAAAASGSAAVFLHCPITQPAHLWAGHVAILLPAAVWASWHALRR